LLLPCLRPAGCVSLIRTWPLSCAVGRPRLLVRS
jgi:hypothetical protein